MFALKSRGGVPKTLPWRLPELIDPAAIHKSVLMSFQRQKVAVGA